MTYSAIEHDQQRGAPIELYEFFYGSGVDDVYRYTNAVQPYTKAGKIFTPIPIQREAIKANGKMEKGNINIRMPLTTDLAELFLPYPPPQVVRVKIWGAHASDPSPTQAVVWVGRALSSARQRNEAVITCENTTLSMKRQGLKRRYSIGCPFALYDTLTCRAEKIAKEVTIAGINAAGSLIMPDNWSYPHDEVDYRGGIIEWQGPIGKEVRTIIRTAGVAIRVNGSLRGIEEGTEASIYLGCPHDRAGCANLHDNINNFGGFSWVPDTSPVKQHPFW